MNRTTEGIVVVTCLAVILTIGIGIGLVTGISNSKQEKATVEKESKQDANVEHIEIKGESESKEKKTTQSTEELIDQNNLDNYLDTNDKAVLQTETDMRDELKALKDIGELDENQEVILKKIQNNINNVYHANTRSQLRRALNSISNHFENDNMFYMFKEAENCIETTYLFDESEIITLNSYKASRKWDNFKSLIYNKRNKYYELKKK